MAKIIGNEMKNEAAWQWHNGGVIISMKGVKMAKIMAKEKASSKTTRHALLARIARHHAAIWARNNARGIRRKNNQRRIMARASNNQ
jgi:hypothetical protein